MTTSSRIGLIPWRLRSTSGSKQPRFAEAPNCWTMERRRGPAAQNESDLFALTLQQTDAAGQITNDGVNSYTWDDAAW